MEIPEEIKSKIINLTLGTKLPTSKILKLFEQEIKIDCKDYYAIIEEYQQKTGVQIVKGMNCKEAPKKISDKEIIDLCERKIPFREIYMELLKNGKAINECELRQRINKLYPSKDGKRSRYVKRKSPKSTIAFSDKEIKDMYESGMSIDNIIEAYKMRGVTISKRTLRQGIRRCYIRMGEKMPTRAEIQDRLITYEDLIRFRDKGFSYKEISNYYKELGIKTTFTYIEKRCKQAFENAKKRDPNANWKNNIADKQRIFELSLAGYSERKITQMFNDEGINISMNTVAKICKQCYKEKGIKNSLKKRRSKTVISDQEIFELCEQGYTYKQMKQYTSNKGGVISTATITKRCKEIYKSRGLDVPKESNIEKSKILKSKVSDGELLKLRKKMTYSQIQKYFAQKGIIASAAYFENRLLKLAKKIDIRCMDENKMKNALLNLKASKGATDEQLKTIGQLYGIDYAPVKERLNPYKVDKRIDER